MSHYQHLTTNERECILFLCGQGKSIRSIAKALGRSAATISRELRRNRFKGDYFPSKADEKYRNRRKRCRRQKILKAPAANSLVKRLFLEQQWSPEEISKRLKAEGNNLQVSTTTIYRAIYSGLFGSTKKDHHGGVCRHLRHRGKTRHHKGKEETRGKIKISNRLENRPEEANKRSELGHLEADTVAGRVSKSCLITITDRKSRFLWVKRVGKRSAPLVTQGLIELLQGIPSDKIHTITPDRGKEFAFHPQVTEALNGLPFYFPNPHAPWERGTNENTNGLIREYCPKSVDIDGFSDEYIQTFTDKLNHRPRKCLDWKSPYEVFYGVVLHLT